MKSSINSSGRSMKAVLPKSPNNPPKNKRRRRRRAGEQKPSQVHLSQCALDYATAVLNPFHPNLQSVCIPDSLEVPSFKFSTKTRGSLSAGTNGQAYIAVCPLTNSNTEPYLRITNVNYAVDGIKVDGNTNTAPCFGFPFTTSAMAVRCVAVGLRVRYTGTLLNRGGSLWAVSAVGEGGSVMNLPSAAVTSNVSARLCPVGDGWSYARWTPASYLQVDYDVVDYNGTNPDAYKLAFWYQGPNGVTATFDYEVVEYWEAIPNKGNTPPSTTKSHSDPVGLGWVRDYLSSLSETEMGQKTLDGFKNFVASRAARVASSYFIPGASAQRMLEL